MELPFSRPPAFPLLILLSGCCSTAGSEKIKRGGCPWRPGWAYARMLRYLTHHWAGLRARVKRTAFLVWKTEKADRLETGIVDRSKLR